MEVVANIWDQVLVVDDLIDLNIIDSYTEHLESLGDYSLTYIIIPEIEEKIYDDGSGVFKTPDDRLESEYLKKLLDSGLVPKIPNHDAYYATKVHKMIVGSLMAIHTDQDYSVAVTTYVSDCVGGELVVEHPKTGELGKIEPKRGRTVILKCDTPHSVLEVTGGERKSLQTFITYYKEDETSE